MKLPKRVLYLSIARIPSRTANSMHIMKMSQAFIQEGYEFKLLATEPQGGEAEFSVPLRTLYGLHTEVPLEYMTPVPPFREYGLAVKATQSARSFKPDIVLTREVPVAAATVAYGIPTLLELHSLEMGPVKRRLTSWLLKRRSLRGLITITQVLKDELRQQFKAAADKPILVAADGVDLSQFSSLPAAPEARRNLDIPEGFTIGYAGHLYSGRGIDLIIELASRNPDLQFLLVGGNAPEVSKYRQEAAIRRLSNIVIRGFVPNSQVPLYLAASEILLMPYEKSVAVSGGGNSVKWMSPMKLFEYMASGRPLIASDLPVLREIINETNAVLCPPGSLPDWLNAIQLLKRSPEIASTLASQARIEVANYSWKRRIQRILEMASEVDCTNAND